MDIVHNLLRHTFYKQSEYDEACRMLRRTCSTNSKNYAACNNNGEFPDVSRRCGKLFFQIIHTKNNTSNIWYSPLRFDLLRNESGEIMNIRNKVLYQDIDKEIYIDDMNTDVLMSYDDEDEDINRQIALKNYFIYDDYDKHSFLPKGGIIYCYVHIVTWV